MKCHYEVLSIARDASDSDIKKSYRKLALKWHPDKNPENLEECTRTFHAIQQAYEVLIDPQERAWYDKHREAILRGGLGRGDNYEDNSLDVFQYFTSSCYSQFNDSEKGFYTVYRKVFETIAAEDLEYMDDAGSDTERPEFGDSNSSYEEVVGPFYGYWESYCTAKSFVWAEKYDTRDAPNRQVRRLMEQDNKKLRDKAKKERNEEVRALVAYVKKRDKRVHAYRKRLEARAAEIARQTEERKQQQRKERIRMLEGFRESGWSATGALQGDLEALEASLAQQFSDHDQEYTDDDTASNEDVVTNAAATADVEEGIDDLYCVACNRAFKTPKAFSNHENSKKHKENVAALREHMLEEDLKNLELDGDAASDDDDDDADADSEFVLYDDLYCLACQKAFDTEHALDSHVQSKKHLKTVAELIGDTSPPIDDLSSTVTESLLEETPAADAAPPSESSTRAPKAKKKRRRRKQENDADDDVEEDDVMDAAKLPTPGQCQGGTAETDVTSAAAATTDVTANGTHEGHVPPVIAATGDHVTDDDDKCVTQEKSEHKQSHHLCNTCRKDFPSRNKLFQHVKATGHALRADNAPDATAVTSQDSAKSRRKKKGKRS